jgi:hypothetical protein
MKNMSNGLYEQVLQTAINLDLSQVKQIKRSDKMYNILYNNNTVSSYTIDYISALLLKNTIRVTQNDKAFLQELSQEMKTQDTRCTAKPYGLVISTEHIVTGFDPNYASDYAYYDNSNSETYYEDDFQDLIVDLENWMDGEQYIELLNLVEEHTISSFYLLDLYGGHLIPNEFTLTGYAKNRTADSMNGCYEGNFFLTEKAANKFIERNKHNLNKPQTYGIHLYRNPEMAKLYNFILNITKD